MNSRLKTVVVPSYANMYEEVRYFNDEAIQQHIDSALDALDAGTNGAVLKMAIDNEGVRAVVAVRPFDHWTIGVVGEIEKSGNYEIGVQSVWTF